MTNYVTHLRNAGDALKDIQILSPRRQTGKNACAYNNGDCEQLCLFNGTHPVCVCSHGQVSEDGKSCQAYNSFIMYSRVIRIDSIHMWDANEKNAPFATIQNKELMRNAIALDYDYKHSRLFYSDIQRGSINALFFNGSDHRIVVENQGSVEGLAFNQMDETLYWSCNNNATINSVKLNEIGTRNTSIRIIVELKNDDKPRGIAFDNCENRIYWTNWNSHHPAIQRIFANGFQFENIITTDIRMPNAITIDHKPRKIYWGDARFVHIFFNPFY